MHAFTLFCIFPDSPAGPGSPCSPLDPVSPVFPLGPVSPSSPLAPVGPCNYTTHFPRLTFRSKISLNPLRSYLSGISFISWRSYCIYHPFIQFPFHSDSPIGPASPLGPVSPCMHNYSILHFTQTHLQVQGLLVHL